MKTTLAILLIATLATAAEWGDPATQQRDAYPREGWLPITQYAPPVAPGYERVRLWVNSTNGVTAFEAYEDAPLPVREFPEGVQAPVVYVPDATGTNGVALVSVGNALQIVDGWGSPRHTRERAQSDADANDRSNVVARAELRAMANTNRAEIAQVDAIRDGVTNALARARAINWGASYNRATQTSAWAIVIDSLVADRQALGEQIDALRRQIDLLQWQKRQQRDYSPEDAP